MKNNLLQIHRKSDGKVSVVKKTPESTGEGSARRDVKFSKETFLKKLQENPQMLVPHVDDPSAIIDFIFEMTPLGTLEWEEGGGFVFLLKGEDKSGMNVSSFLGFGKLLQEISNLDGFERLIANFGNPTQFEQTQFEVYVAHFLSKRGRLSGLKLSPEIQIGGSKKVPEASFDYDGETIYCECKTVNPHTHKFKATFEKSVELIHKVVEQFDIPTNLRLDIDILETPNEQQVSDLGNLLAQQFTSSEIKTIGCFKICFSERTNPPAFTNFNFSSSSQTIPDKAVQIHWSNQWLRITQLDRKLKKKVRELIADACTQLPPDRKGLVFIQATNREAAEAAAREAMLSSDKKAWLHGVVVVSDVWQLITRTEAVSWLNACFEAGPSVSMEL